MLSPAAFALLAAALFGHTSLLRRRLLRHAPVLHLAWLAFLALVTCGIVALSQLLLVCSLALGCIVLAHRAPHIHQVLLAAPAWQAAPGGAVHSIVLVPLPNTAPLLHACAVAYGLESLNEVDFSSVIS